MTKQEWQDLQMGDVITNQGTANGYVVVGFNYNCGLPDPIISRTIIASNPSEWDKFIPHQPEHKCPNCHLKLKVVRDD